MKIIQDLAFFDMNENDYESIQKCFAYKHKLWNPTKIDGWEIGSASLTEELAREGEDVGNSEIFQYIDNKDFSICASYPEVLFAPKSMTLAEIKACAAFRTKNRMPALTYYYQKNGCQIWRSSQP